MSAKFSISAFLAMMLTIPCSAFDLSPGKPFPAVTLPSISTGEQIAVNDQLGEKLMLHLFASW